MLSVPSADLLNLGPAASMTDSTGVGPAAGAGTFSALLEQQGEGLRAAPAGATGARTQGGDADDGALAAAPLSTTILPHTALPPLEPRVLPGSPIPHNPTDLRQLPARQAGASLPPIGNTLPQHLGDQVSTATMVGPGEPLKSLTPIAQVGVQGLPASGEPELPSGPAPGPDASGVSRPRAEPGSAVSRPFESYGPAAAKTVLDGPIPDPQVAVPATQLAARARQNEVSAALSPYSGSSPKLSHGGYSEEVRAAAPASGAQGLMAAIQARYKPESSIQPPIQSDVASAARFVDAPVVGLMPGAQGPLTSGTEGGSLHPAAATGGTLNGQLGGTSRTVESPVGGGSWGSEIAGHVRSLAGEGNVHRAELRLNPAHLGPVEVRLSLRGDETHVTFVAAEGIVRDALQETLPRLRELLAEQGLNLGQTRVLDQHSANPDDREAAYRRFAGASQAETAESAGVENGPVTGSSRPGSGRPSSLVDAYI